MVENRDGTKDNGPWGLGRPVEGRLAGGLSVQEGHRKVSLCAVSE